MLTRLEAHTVLETLFARARAIDEFEYASTLANLTGLKGAGWFAETESQVLVRDLMTLQAALTDNYTKLRIGLLVYTHIIEMDIGYHLVGNMLRVCRGDRYSMLPFVTKTGDALIYPVQKIAKITAWSRRLELDAVSKLFAFYSNQIRNAFVHANYQLFADRFNIVRGKSVLIDGVLTPSVPIDTELVPRINGALEFFYAFFDGWQSARAAYTENVPVIGRIYGDGSFTEITLTTEPNYGLIGFTSSAPPFPETDERVIAARRRISDAGALFRRPR